MDKINQSLTSLLCGYPFDQAFLFGAKPLSNLNDCWLIVNQTTATNFVVFETNMHQDAITKINLKQPFTIHDRFSMINTCWVKFDKHFIYQIKHPQAHIFTIKFAYEVRMAQLDIIDNHFLLNIKWTQWNQYFRTKCFMQQ